MVLDVFSVLSAALSMATCRMTFGPPVPVGGGGKMSNTLDLYPDGFGSAMGLHPVISVDSGTTFRKVDVRVLE